MMPSQLCLRSCKSAVRTLINIGLQVLILENAAARAATAELLQIHCIPSDRSVDLGGGEPVLEQPPS